MGLWVMVAMLRGSDLGHGSQWQVDVVGGGAGGFFFFFFFSLLWFVVGGGNGGFFLVRAWVVGFWWL